VIRLKAATWTDGQVMIKPSISEQQQKQAAVLRADKYSDEQLKALLNFVDVNDPSMVNLLYSSFARLYEKMSKNEYSIHYLNDDVKLETEFSHDSLAKQFYNSFKNSIEENFKQNSHKARIDPKEVQRLKDARFVNQDRACIETSHSVLRRLPVHLVQCYLTLKHMKMRDSKTRLLKILNFYRSVQKRIVLELKEFSRREVVNNQVKTKAPEEAFYVDTKAANIQDNYANMNLEGDEIDKGTFKSHA